MNVQQLNLTNSFSKSAYDYATSDELKSLYMRHFNNILYSDKQHFNNYTLGSETGIGSNNNMKSGGNNSNKPLGYSLSLSSLPAAGSSSGKSNNNNNNNNSGGGNINFTNASTNEAKMNLLSLSVNSSGGNSSIDSSNITPHLSTTNNNTTTTIPITSTTTVTLKDITATNNKDASNTSSPEGLEESSTSRKRKIVSADRSVY
jgi:hypothetical protein